MESSFTAIIDLFFKLYAPKRGGDKAKAAELMNAYRKL